MVEKTISNKYIFSFFFLQKVANVSEDLIAIGSWFQIVGVATGKACLLILRLVLGTKSYFETGIVMVLIM